MQTPQGTGNAASTPRGSSQNGQNGQQQQQQYLPQRLNGEWQSNRDMKKRREMIQHIVRLLKQKDKNASPEWLQKLPQMVKQLEVSLYRNAPSFEAYADTGTLKHRLQLLAMEIARKTDASKSGGSGSGSGASPPSAPGGGGTGMTVSSSSGSSRSRSQPQQQQQHRGSAQPPPLSSSSSSMPPGGIVNMNDINPAMGGWSGGGSSSAPSPSNQYSSSSQHHRPSSSSQHHRDSASSGRGGRQMTETERDNIVRTRHKQQRLLLLHHASKCTHPEGRCPITNHCADMKRLWKHMARCTDTNCRVSHCFSSRSILSHYRKCKDPSCRACGPVRETVRRSGGNSVSLPPPPQGYYPSSSSQSDQTSYGSMQPGMMSSSSTPQGGMGSSSGQYGQSGRSSHNDMHSSSNRLRHKQQRLLLLRHASKCPYEEGKCPVTEMCAGMKRLWTHISKCKDQQCKVSHCMSSRYVLSHYRRCKDTSCPACEPVRDVIRRSQAEAQAEASRGHTISAHEVEARLLNQLLQEAPAHELGGRSGSSPYGYGGVAPSMSSSSYNAEQRASKRPRVHENAVMSPAAAGSMGSHHPAMAASMSTSRTSAKGTPSAGSSATSSKPEDASSFSLINSFTVDQIEKHLASLNRMSQLPPAQLKVHCLDLLKVLMQHEHGWVFNCPVDPVELGLPDYLDIIKKPMDLGTIQKKLERGDNGQYHSLDDFCADVHLTFDNATLYNEEGSTVHSMASELKDVFVVEHKKVLAQLKSEEEARRKNDRACGLCGCEKLLFEPPVYFCNGMNCASKRIRRNSHYYIGGGNQYFWCTTCFNELDGRIPIEVGDLSMQKAELLKKKNDEVHEESWVQCDTCERWIHQICGLFNARQNKEHKSEYNCPSCLLKMRKRQKKKTPGSASSLPGAEALPRTKLSEALESHVRSRVGGHVRSLAEGKAQSENIPLEDAMKQMSLGGPITIRQVTSTDRKVEVREGMLKRYKHKNYPEEFPFRCKCIVVFQNLDGVDVILFALYVYEHGDNNPAPNKKTVYISYLDSVHFMKPRKIRTFVYHEILICYLDYVRKKGFSTAHIWACPPLKGDDYIFYAKPEDQKTPKDTRLRMWYIDMLVECQKRGICGKVTNMHDQYFTREQLDASDVPYLEGDYFPGEAENIIAELDKAKGKGKGKKGGVNGKKSKKKRKKKDDDDEDWAEDDEPAPKDEVMVKLGELISPMKESFIVAFLNCDDQSEENKEVPKAIVEYRKKAAHEAVDNDGTTDGSTTKDNNGTDGNETKDNDGTDGSGGDVAASSSDTRKKRDADGNIRVVSADSSKSSAVEADGSQIKIINDDEEEMDCEFLNDRQAFLNLCRGNHYQFDELRRAKHTSMMVLWHLHNRGAPKFVQSCGSCGKEILSGTRWHCPVCPDFDLCTDCYRNPHTNRGACTHKMEAISVEGGGSDESGGSGLTEAQRRERQRNIQLHIQLIEHASQCNSRNCGSQNCAKMKAYLKHSLSCQIKASGGCKICKRIWTLLRFHAQNCKVRDCPMPQCNGIRERIRQLKKQQQAMDDRRRQEMNRHFMAARAAQLGR